MKRKVKLKDWMKRLKFSQSSIAKIFVYPRCHVVFRLWINYRKSIASKKKNNVFGTTQNEAEQSCKRATNELDCKNPTTVTAPKILRKRIYTLTWKTNEMAQRTHTHTHWHCPTGQIRFIAIKSAKRADRPVNTEKSEKVSFKLQQSKGFKTELKIICRHCKRPQRRIKGKRVSKATNVESVGRKNV